MKRKRRHLLIACCMLAPAATLFLPGLPWSARCRYVTRRVSARLGSTVAAWSGIRPRPISLTGKLTGGGALVQALKGAQLVAIESASGYAAASDGEGRFVLPHLVWYPDAAYTLLVTADAFHARAFTLHAPPTFPDSGMIDVGDLHFEDGAEVAPAERPVRYVRYDRENRDYYRQLFERLTANAASDHLKISAVCRYVAGKLTADGGADQPSRYMNDQSPRQVLESGSCHCSKLALAFVTLAEAGNYKTRILDLIGEPQPPSAHMVAEVYYDDRWHLYDPVAGTALRRPGGRIASYKEIYLEDNASLPQTLPAHLPAIAGLRAEPLARLYRSGLHHYYYLKP